MHGRDIALVIVAVGLSAALVLITGAILADALLNATGFVSQNAHALLSGLIGLLGSFIGYRAGTAAADGARREIPGDRGTSS
jgi:hypothetical protein